VAHFGNRYILPYDKHSTPAIQKKPRTGDGVLTDFTEEKNETGEIIRVRLPKKGNREMFGCAELMMGANHIRVRCFDGVTRLGRIKGKIKKEGLDP
jgi:translation initiation factor IF-1